MKNHGIPKKRRYQTLSLRFEFKVLASYRAFFVVIVIVAAEKILQIILRNAAE